MKWSLTIATIAGTKVRVHFTFLLLLFWIAAEFWRAGGSAAAIGGLTFYLSLFLCVLLHEFGHVTAARCYGVKTPTITLLPIGGLAQLERIPKNPTSELVIALAGPMVNVVIVLVLSVVTRVAPNFDLQLQLDPSKPVALLPSILWINVMLAVFNMLPAFPMDGGRAFRALLAYVMPWENATRWAATTGQGLALVGGCIALLAHNPFLLFIAVFIFIAASAELASAETDRLLQGTNVAAAAIAHFRTLRPENQISDAVGLLLDGSQRDFPVVDDSGRPIGVLTREHIIHALSELGAEASVGQAMQTDFPVFRASRPVGEALQILTELRLSAAPVIDASGQLSRWLTKENIAELMMTRSAVAKHHD